VISYLLAVLLAASSPCEQAFSVAEGDSAPCSGVLVPSSEALDCMSCIRVNLPECAAKFRFLHRECQINLEALDSAVQAERDRGDNLQAALAEGLRGPPWYEHPAFVMIGGVLLGSTATWAALKHLD